MGVQNQENKPSERGKTLKQSNLVQSNSKLSKSQKPSSKNFTQHVHSNEPIFIQDEEPVISPPETDVRSIPRERDSSPLETRGDPLSMKELQSTPQTNSVNRAYHKSMSASRRENINFASASTAETKSKIKEQVLSSLPDSIKKVKEDIKKKIEK